MAPFFSLLFHLSSIFAFSSEAMIYGNDDRLEREQIKDPGVISYSRSTAALTLKSHLILNHDHSYSVDFKAGAGREKNDGACKTPFMNQPDLVSYCSATLIAPDLLLTSGHCFYRGETQSPAEVCAQSVALFDFAIDQNSKDPVRFAPEQVFQCQKLEIYSHQGDDDFAVIRLDRKVTGREIFHPANPSHTVLPNPKLNYWTSGYPRGMPNKTILNGKYFDFWGDSNLTALFQMEVMGGTSGSSVIDPISRRILGLVASSDCSDLEWSEENKCFYEPVFSGQCRGVRVVLLENLGIEWQVLAKTAVK